MCLETLWTKAEIKEWLKTQPDDITAYKVVKLGESDGKERAFPVVYWEYGAFKKVNKITRSIVRRVPHVIVLGKYRQSRRSYETYYHLFLMKDDAQKWKETGPSAMFCKVLKCKIPKKAITDIGKQINGISIITKEFTFVQGNKYFGENK